MGHSKAFSNNNLKGQGVFRCLYIWAQGWS
jgi:hypothetical protein